MEEQNQVTCIRCGQKYNFHISEIVEYRSSFKETKDVYKYKDKIPTCPHCGEMIDLQLNQEVIQSQLEDMRKDAINKGVQNYLRYKVPMIEKKIRKSKLEKLNKKKNRRKK